MSTLRLTGSSSGFTEVTAPAVAGSNTLVLPTGNGSSGQFLQTNGSGALSWAGGGKILQVVQNDYQSEVSSSSTSYTEITGLATSITLASSSNKVLFCGSLQVGNNTATGLAIRIKRDTTIISRDPFKWHFIPNNDAGGTMSWMFLDTPGVSNPTYKIEWRADNANAIYLNRTNTNTANEKGASQIILQEVAA
jgi:hypothetical protein